MDQSRGTSLETIIIFTTRMEELAQFYREALELGEFNLSPGHIGLQVGPVYLGFDQVETRYVGGGTTLWFTVDDIVATFNHLVEMHALVKYPPTRKPWGGYLSAVYDLDGNLIGLSQREKEVGEA